LGGLKRRFDDLNKNRWKYTVFVFILLLTFLAGCTLYSKSVEPDPTIEISPSPSLTNSPLPTALPPTSLPPRHVPRFDYPTPQIDPITPIPDPFTGLLVPDEVRLLVLLGSDNPSPFTSRTDAIMLAFYNPRLAKVALLSIPPEMFVYIPGYTMQRINVAYAVGGFKMLADTIEYNFGIRPDEYIVVHEDDFAWFGEELGGLDVDVFRNYYDYCGGIPAGNIHFGGGDILCFVSFRDGWDIQDQAARQQQVVWQFFSRMTRSGKLVELDDIFLTYKNVVESNLSVFELVNRIPLAIRLGQADRFGYFYPSFDMFTLWQVPGAVKAQVLLPRGNLLLNKIQKAIEFTMISVQSSDLVLTLEYELTVSPTPTNTPTATFTNTATASRTPTTTPIRTATITPGGPTLTPTNTVEGYPAPQTQTITTTGTGYP
jgi:LCP family protein required for cell wall assembly